MRIALFAILIAVAWLVCQSGRATGPDAELPSAMPSRSADPAFAGEDRGVGTDGVAVERALAVTDSGSTWEVDGRTILPSGRPVACRVALFRGGDESTVGAEVVSGADGRFALSVPEAWHAAELVARTDAGAEGRLQVTKGSTTEVELTLHRYVDVTLRLGSGAELRAAAGGAFPCSVAVRLQKWPITSLLHAGSEQELARWELGDEEQQASVRVDCVEANALAWYLERPGDVANAYHRDVIPPGVDAFESRCQFDVSSLLLVELVDPAGRPVAHTRFFAWSDRQGSLRRYACRTDASGRCLHVVRRSDSGRLELPWRYPSWFDGSGAWSEDPDCPTWAAGAFSRLVVDQNRILRVRFEDHRGVAIERCWWRTRNDGLRSWQGRKAAERGEYGSVAHLVGVARLAAGSVLFVTPEGGEESYAVLGNDLVAGPRIHTLRLADVKPRNLTIVVEPTFPARSGGEVSLRLRSAPEDPVPKQYLIAFTRSAGRQEVVVEQVLPGRYRLTAADGRAFADPGPIAFDASAVERWEVVLR